MSVILKRTAVFVVFMFGIVGVQAEIQSKLWLPLGPGVYSKAVYGDLINTGEEDVELSIKSCEGFGHAMLHETVKENDQLKMRHIEKHVIKSGEKLLLQRGGKHLMLMKQNADLEPGQQFDCLFNVKYQDKSSEVIRATVVVKSLLESAK